MKKLLFFALILFSCLPSYAQLQKTTVLDFTNPTQLNPAQDVTEINYTNGVANLAKTTFFSDDISLSFSKGTGNTGFGAYLKNYLHNSETNTGNYGLEITQNTRVTFEALDGATLNSIEFDASSNRGGLSLEAGEPGALKGLKWTTTDNNVHAVTFANYSTRSKLCIITVTYTAPQNVLTPSASIYNGEVMTSFRSIMLTFPNTMTAENTSGITISGTGMSSTTMQTSVSGRTVTLSLPYSITTDGDFTITVPAGSFSDSEGYRNADLTYTFSVREPRNTFNVLSVDPPSGSTMEVLQFPITLTFPNDEENYVGYVNSSVIYLRRQGVSNPIAQLTAELNDNGQVELNVKGNVTSFTTGGVYNITINEKTVYNQMYGTDYARYNSAFNLTYTVVEPVDPLKDLKDEAAMLKKLIASTIGYPAVGSDADALLTNVTDPEANPTKEDLEAAIAAFYNETSVVMPTVGKWYNIIGVNSNKKTAYIGYSGGKAFVTNNVSESAAFQLVQDGDDYAFMTADGKYLMSLSDNDNVVDEMGKASKLTLAKLVADKVDPKKTLALFTIYGWLGRDANDADLGYSFSTINHSTGKVAATPVETPVFTTSNSSAFMFSETNDPTYVEPITPAMSLSSTSVLTTTSSIILYLDNINYVTLKDGTKPYFSSDAAGQKRVASAKLVADGRASFVVTLSGLAAGTYYLQLPLGTFEYGQNDTPVTDEAKSLQFTISEPESFFKTEYTTYVVLQVAERNRQSIDVISDKELNDLVVMAQVPLYYTDLVPDPKQEVTIFNYYNGTVVGRGHFEPFTNFNKVYPTYYKEGYKAIKLVMDEPVEAGSLQYSPDTYGYSVNEATFGDAKFKDYLAGKKGVKKEDCIVNKAGSLCYFMVNNEKATTGISEITAPDADAKVYDLMGRRVDNTAKKGIYIVNGKKVVIK